MHIHRRGVNTFLLIVFGEEAPIVFGEEAPNRNMRKNHI